MTQFYSFPSIEQFRTVIKYVNDRCAYHAVDKPTLKFVGTVKIHGTNAGVVVTPTGDVYAQSRSSVIVAAVNDNAGFAAWVAANKARFIELAKRVVLVRGEPYDDCDIVLYGEWCGQGIQKGVAVNQLSKRFIMFAARVVTPEASDDYVHEWFLPSELAAISYAWDDELSSIHNFPKWEIEIDFKQPALSQNKLVELTTAVEAECPVGKAYGVSGIGEGIVWVCTEYGQRELDARRGDGIKTSDLIFKVKGEKHSDTKTKTLAPVDVEKMEAIAELAEAVATEHRFEKGLDFVKLQNPNVDIMAMMYVPQFLKWVGQDVIKEESDMIAASGFDVKDVTKAVNQLAREWFKEQVESDLKIE